jgi:hypothetical protein
VTIPGLGDLSPPHRHVPIGRWLVTVLVVALLAGGGYAAFLGLSGGPSNSSASQLPPCPLPSTHPAAQKLGPLRLTVKNATERIGLAASVQIDLENRGFKVTSIGNTVLMKKGVATVRYSADRRLVADKVAAQIKGAVLVLAGGHGVVELDLGPKFHTLVTTKQARVAYRRLLSQTAPTPTPSTSCRPQTLGSPSG